MNEEIEVIPGGAVLTGRNAQENSKQEPPRKALPHGTCVPRNDPGGEERVFPNEAFSLA